MKHLKVALPLALLSAASASAFAGPIVLNLSGLGDEEPILNYFNGGLGGNLSGPGPADGIVFSSNSLALISTSQGGKGNFDNNPSGGPIAFFLSGAADTMNVAAGFTTGFSFFYSSTEVGSVTLWSGLNGTGTELADIALNANSPGPGCPAGNSAILICQWDPVGVTFSGTAESSTLAALRTRSPSMKSPSVLRPPAAARWSLSRAACFFSEPAWSPSRATSADGADEPLLCFFDRLFLAPLSLVRCLGSVALAPSSRPGCPGPAVLARLS
jgi:hypothetical protein